MSKWWYQGYVVNRKDGPDEWRGLVYFGESEEGARYSIRTAIASGFDYGYIKQGFETVAYLTESSFLSVAK